MFQCKLPWQQLKPDWLKMDRDQCLSLQAVPVVLFHQNQISHNRSSQTDVGICNCTFYLPLYSWVKFTSQRYVLSLDPTNSCCKIYSRNGFSARLIYTGGVFSIPGMVMKIQVCVSEHIRNREQPSGQKTVHLIFFAGQP